MLSEMDLGKARKIAKPGMAHEYKDLSSFISGRELGQAEGYIQAKGEDTPRPGNDGGPAFPGKSWKKTDPDGFYLHNSNGMTIRDWFAGTASDESVSRASREYMEKYSLVHCTVAEARFFYADAMLKQKEK